MLIDREATVGRVPVPESAGTVWRNKIPLVFGEKNFFALGNWNATCCADRPPIARVTGGGIEERSPLLGGPRGFGRRGGVGPGPFDESHEPIEQEQEDGDEYRPPEGFYGQC